jgi:cobalt/nickel transport system ATP-binding protein
VSHHLVEAEGLRHVWPDGTVALDGVSFRITHGEAVGVVGANGAGKSTLLLYLAGALVPREGRVRVGDVPVTRTLETVRRAVGTVIQDPDDQLFLPTVRDDVAFGPLNLGLPPGEVEARVASAPDAVDAGPLARRAPWRLSGGEKRRVAIATVLAMGPDVLVLDEPSSGLDPRSRRELIDLLRAFHHTRVVATHDLDLVLDVCGRTIALDRGTAVADGPTRTLLSDDALLARCQLERPLPSAAGPEAAPQRENASNAAFAASAIALSRAAAPFVDAFSRTATASVPFPPGSSTSPTSLAQRPIVPVLS